MLETFISSKVLRECAMCLLHTLTPLFLLLLIIVQIFYIYKNMTYSNDILGEMQVGHEQQCL